MAFDLSNLPAPVQLAFQASAPSLWSTVVFGAIACGVRNANDLADLAFHLHHPELSGRAIRPSETGLIAEWRSYHSHISKALSSGKDTPRKSEDDVKREQIVDALDQIRLNNFVRDATERDEFALMIRLAKLYFKGKPVDPRCWSFTATNGMGVPVGRGQSPHFVKRTTFKSGFWRLEPNYILEISPTSVGKTLHDAYIRMGRETDTLFRWHRKFAGVGDASTRGRIEMQYIKDVCNKATTSRPVSIYYAFGKRIGQFGVIVPWFTLANME